MCGFGGAGWKVEKTGERRGGAVGWTGEENGGVSSTETGETEAAGQPAAGMSSREMLGTSRLNNN